MKTTAPASFFLTTVLLSIVTSGDASEGNWSVVAHLGSSRINDQSPTISNATDLTNGSASAELDNGFTTGLGVRYDYAGSPWISELGWEYRSNDAQTTTADNTRLPGGNYASNIFYINARYQFAATTRLTPWVGAGLTWVQEIDLDSEDASGERSFSDSGAAGVQLLVGADYDLTEKFYLSGEFRYSDISNLVLTREGGSGEIRDLDYQPLTLTLGIGYRF